MTERTSVGLGLRANWRQFWLLVAVNAFVGAMVGLERTVLPLIADQEFSIVSRSAVLSFLITFGLVKAATNFFAGVASMHGANAVPKKAEDQACGRRVVSALNELWDLTRTVEPAMAAHQIRREELSAADVEDCAAWLAGLASEIEKAI